MLLVGGTLAALDGTARADSPVTGQVTRGSDTNRTNWYSNQPNLSPANVANPAAFGALATVQLSGQIMAQPLVANNVLTVATENNVVYGLNPQTGATLWQRQFGTPYDPTGIVNSNTHNVVGCGDLVPNVGITSTPVVDTVTNTIYLVANEVISGVDQYRLHALDLSTGAEKANFPTVMEGTADNRNLTFDATHQTQRAGLLLLNGVVYVAFSAHCQVPNWSGWVMGVNGTTGTSGMTGTAGAITARWADHTGTSTATSGGGIWMAGGGLASDGDGNILFAIGNALTPNAQALAGSAAPSDMEWSNAVVRMHVGADKKLSVADFFVPQDETYLDTNDLDLGSGGVTLLPDSYFGTASYPHLAVAAGKSGIVYLLNRDDLGGEQQGPNNSDDIIAKYGPNGGVWSQPSVWPGDGGYVYLPTAGPSGQNFGQTGNLAAYSYGTSNGTPGLTLAATSSETWGFGSSAAMVTSDGVKNGSALLWAIKSTQQGNGGGVPSAELVAYNAVPQNGDFTRVAHFSIGTGNKFTPPGFGPGGYVYTASYNGQLSIFGPQNTGISASTVEFGTTGQGVPVTANATITATAPTTITALTPNGPYSVGTPSPALGTTLTAGQSMTVPLTFTPTGVGTATGSLTVSTNGAPIALTLVGTGVAAGPHLAVTPGNLDFGNVTANPAGTNTVTNNVTITNTGSSTATISSIAEPNAPFSILNGPAQGTTIAPQASVQATVQFAPTTLGAASGTYTVVSNGGTIAVPLTGTGATAGAVTISPLTTNYGSVNVGSALVKSFTVTNTGGTSVTISVSKAPTGGSFHALTTLGEGTTVQPGGSVTEQVAFTPATAGSLSDTWQITPNDGQGARTVTFTGTGVGTSLQLPPLNGSGWALNGGASAISGGVNLTNASDTYTAGSTFNSALVSTNNLAVTFDAQLSGGTGADGLTLTLANPATESSNSLGEPGGGLGFSGINGVAIALDTHSNGSVNASNFVGISSGADPNDQQGQSLTWLASTTSPSLPNLRGGVVHVKVTAVNNVVTVFLNGTQVLSATVGNLPGAAIVGFTAGNGGSTDTHVVTNATITSTAVGGVPDPTGSIGSTLATNATLSAGQWLTSGVTGYRAFMQGDGNFVIYTATNAVLFSTGTYNHPGARLANQGDGNLVIYSTTNQALWFSGKFITGPTNLVMQGDGNLVQYSGSQAIWNSGTSTSPPLAVGGRLNPGQQLRAGTGYSLVMQGDGNLVIYSPAGQAIWSSKTSNHPGAYLLVQGDGNVVIYGTDGKPLFWTGTQPNANVSLMMATDGSLLVLSNGGAALWNSKQHP